MGVCSWTFKAGVLIHYFSRTKLALLWSIVNNDYIDSLIKQKKIMDKQELNNAYAQIERSLEPIRTFIEKKLDDETIKKNYKGFITLQGPLVHNPEILFLGINPGQGAYVEHQLQNKEGYPVRVFDPNSPLSLDWYKNGNARGRMNNGQWVGYKWYERSKQINNPFVANMIDLLYAISAIRKPDDQIALRDGEQPDWYEDFGKRLMFTNLYPIATTKASDLDPIFSLMVKHPETKSLFGEKGRLRKWDAQLFFISRVEQLIGLVKPKVIVCLGIQSYNDFTYTSEKKKDRVFKTVKGNIPVIGLDRSGNWSGSIPLLAKEIATCL